MTGTTDYSELTIATARQLVDAAIAESGYRILWQQNSLDAAAPAITVGFPRCRGEFEDRLIWWPGGVCELHRVAVMSSRIGAQHDQQQWWYDLLRTAVLRLNADVDCVVAVEGTATHDAVVRAAELFGLSCLKTAGVEGTATHEELAEWLIDRISRLDEFGKEGQCWRADVGPALTLDAGAKSHPDVPGGDWCCLELGERTYVLACRDHGNIHQLLRAGLVNGPDSARLICVADSEGTSSKILAELSELGAIPWLVEGVSDTSRNKRRRDAISQSQPMPLENGPLTHPDGWLCHWTRPREGPWPDQPEIDFLDELILGCETADRSALATLLQIIGRRAIIASKVTVKGDVAVVSFTEVPLADFRKRRIWRRHRRRYDFEPWGIAIRRDVLTAMGARKVVYGSLVDREQLSHDDVVWFQPTTDQSGRIDWSEEREWRVPDDVLLENLPTTSACVFVHSTAEASMLSDQCCWPVIVVSDEQPTEDPPGSHS